MPTAFQNLVVFDLPKPFQMTPTISLQDRANTRNVRCLALLGVALTRVQRLVATPDRGKLDKENGIFPVPVPA